MNEAKYEYPVSTITIPPEPYSIQAALDFAESLATGLDFDPREQKHIRLAIEETISFLKETSLLEDEAHPVTISFRNQADGMMIRIISKGLPLDIRRMSSFSPEKVSEDVQFDTLSVFIAKKIMDKMEYLNHGREGIEVELFKCRSASHVRSLITDAECRKAEATGREAHDSDEYTIRSLRESEALEVSRCAYLTYGYTYEDYIYYPERIIEMNRSGELSSFLAINRSNTVMGHCALKFDPNRRERAELGVLFVRPDFRRHRIGAALWKNVTDYAREKRLESIFARSVTGHRASQTMAEQNGFSDCALALGLFPRSVNLKDLGGLQSGKMSGMFQWLNLFSKRERRLDLPERYVEICEELYKRAKIEMETGTNSNIPKAVEPAFRIRRIPVLNVGFLEIEHSGCDINAAINWMFINFRRLCRDKLDVIYLHVNAEESGASLIAEKAMALGFIFSGINPDAFERGDALVLQYLNLQEDPFADMTVWTDTAALLFDFIRDEWEKINS